MIHLKMQKENSGTTALHKADPTPEVFHRFFLRISERLFFKMVINNCHKLVKKLLLYIEILIIFVLFQVT